MSCMQLHLQRGEGVFVEVELHDVFEAARHDQTVLDLAQTLFRQV